MPFDMTPDEHHPALELARSLRRRGQPWSAVVCGIHFKCASTDERNTIVRHAAMEERYQSVLV